jgi:hypothetical protein
MGLRAWWTRRRERAAELERQHRIAYRARPLPGTAAYDECVRKLTFGEMSYDEFVRTINAAFDTPLPRDERRVFPNIAHTRRIAREEIERYHAERFAARTPEQEL